MQLLFFSCNTREGPLRYIVYNKKQQNHVNPLQGNILKLEKCL